MEKEQQDGAVVSFFKERDECLASIHSLVLLEKEAATRWRRTGERSITDNQEKDEEDEKDEAEKGKQVERLELVLVQYQEQPHLLDPHLDDIISPLIAAARLIRDSSSPLHAPPHLLYRVLYLISKVRGPKTVGMTHTLPPFPFPCPCPCCCTVSLSLVVCAVRFFSHEASDLEPTLQLLQSQEGAAQSKWETRYVLLLWLSILSLVPFDLKNIDSAASGDHVWLTPPASLSHSCLPLSHPPLPSPLATCQAHN